MGVNFFDEDDPEDFSRFDLSFLALFWMLSGEPWPEHLSEASALGWPVNGDSGLPARVFNEGLPSGS